MEYYTQLAPQTAGPNDRLAADQRRIQIPAAVRAAAAAIRANAGLVLLSVALVLMASRANPDLEEQYTQPHLRADSEWTELLARAGAALLHQVRNMLGPGWLGPALSVRYRWHHQDSPTTAAAMHGELAGCGLAAVATMIALYRTIARPTRAGTSTAAALFWLCYVALLLPTTGLFVQHGVTMLTADRYSYLPLLLLGTPALAHGLHGAINMQSSTGSSPVVEVCVGTAVAAVVAVEVQATVSYSAVWVNSTSLWRHVVSVDPLDAPALSDLAGAILATLPPPPPPDGAVGQQLAGGNSRAVVLQEALGWYDRAVALELPLSSPAAQHAQQRGDDRRRFGDIWSNRGLVLGAFGGQRSAEALASYEHAASVYSGQGGGVGFASVLTEAALFTNWGAMLAGLAR